MDPITLSPTHHFFSTQSRLAASPSPLRSPTRRQHFINRDFDHLLSELSPSSTLEALQANDLLPLGDKASKSFIQESVASASTLERAWGVKAALAAMKVREWYAEVGTWIWPGFNHPPLEEPANGRAQHHHEVSTGRSSSSEAIRPSGSSLVGKQAIGSLSSKLMQEYEERIQAIRNDLETLEIDDLKNYVRNAHWNVSSRRSSLREPPSFGLATDYDHLDDFTAVITATIVQALPTISRLETLLNTWSTRLLVLRQVPSFLTDLDSGRESMVSASIAIGARDALHHRRRPDFSWKAFSDIRAVLQDQIAELGRKLDRMLDLLEGSIDTLPDAWIDGLDHIESEYSAWVVKAERVAMNRELRNERLEKDYTQDRTDELLDLDGPRDLRHTASDVETSAQFDEFRRRADSDFDLTQHDPLETLKTENANTESSTESSNKSFSLEPLPSRDALLEQLRAQLRGSAIHSVDGQTLGQLSNRPKTPSLPIRTSHRPAPLMLAASKANVESPEFPDAASDTSGSGFSASNYSSNKSSPEIQSAVLAEYIGTPVRFTSPKLSNKEPLTSAEIAFRRLGPPAEGDGPRIQPSGVQSDFVSKNVRHNKSSGHSRARSASLQSYEPVAKHEIRRIQVRSGSYSSALSLSDPEYGQVQPSRRPPSFAGQHGELQAFRITRPLPATRETKDQQSPPPAQNKDPRHDKPKQQSLYHSPPPVSVQSSTSAQSSVRESRPPRQQFTYHSPPAVSPSSAHPTQSLDSELDTAEHRPPYHSPPPVLPRSAHRFEQVSDLSPGSTPVKIRQMKPNDATGGHTPGPVETPRTGVVLSPKNLDDQLEERISSILTELPTQIRLRSGPEPDAPEVTRFNSPSDVRKLKVRSPAWRLKRRQTSNPLPSLTLAPAQPKSTQSRSPTTEPDIKLYHLHQPGKTAPIKLFVRLVGEGGERVMVRIGGGWADLGEYLREYAGHHGRRSVSDNPFDITGLPSSSSPLANDPSPRSRPGSRPISPPSAMKHSPANRLARQQTSPAIFTSPHTPQSNPSTRNSPRLSWAAGDDDVPPSLGLAGPTTKNVDISPRKQAWVDEMMERARLGGGEKKGGGESVVGDLGKVGRTRRVFFKSRKEG